MSVSYSLHSLQNFTQSNSLMKMTYRASCCSSWSSSSLSICDCFLYLSLLARSSLNSTFTQHFTMNYTCCINRNTQSSLNLLNIYSVSQKTSPPPKKKLFAIFSLALSVFPLNFANLLSVYIHTFTYLPILVDLS